MIYSQVRSMIFAAVTAGAVVFSFTFPVQAEPASQSQSAAPKSEWARISEFTKKLEDEGHGIIYDVERKAEGWKVKLTDSHGVRHKLRLDKNGNVLYKEPK